MRRPHRTSRERRIAREDEEPSERGGCRDGIDVVREEKRQQDRAGRDHGQDIREGQGDASALSTPSDQSGYDNECCDEGDRWQGEKRGVEGRERGATEVADHEESAKPGHPQQNGYGNN